MKRLLLSTASTLLLFTLLPLAAHGQGIPADAAQIMSQGYALDTILVKFRPDVESAAVTRISREAGMVSEHTYDQIDVHLFRVADRRVTETIELLSLYPEVEFAEPNYVRQTFFTPNDPSYGQQWAFPKIRAESAWDITLGSNDIVVAMIDTGVDQDHPELVNQRWINIDEIPNNQIDDDGNGYVDDAYGYDFFGTALFGLIPPPEGDEDPDPEDDNGHGSHTGGTVAAATDNGIGVAGTASDCRIMVIRALGGLLGMGYSSDIISAMLYAADNGANIVSMSLGSTQFSQAELAAVVYGENLDVLFVAAAGNGGNTALNYPAGYPQVMAVSATNSSDSLAGFSTQGANVELAAPGVNILSTWKGGGYYTADGTSMACPHAAGVAALVRSLDPTLTASQVRQMVRAGTVDLGTPGWDFQFGDGRLDAYGALTVPVPDPTQIALLTPGDGSTLNSGASPFGFGWTGTAGAATYAIQIQLPSGGTITLTGLSDNYYYPSQSSWNSAQAGVYMWRAAALNGSGQVITVTDWWEFNL